MRFGPGFASTFLYYFVTTTIIMTAIALRATGLGLDSGFPQQFGLLIGLLGGMAGGYFNRTTTFSVSSASPTKLLKLLETILADMGYEVSEESERFDDDIALYQRSGLRSFFSGNVFVQIEKRQITVAARSISLKRIQAALEDSN
ncbi:MAG: hypothetical protein AAGD25_10595 [Cyanobacteria bacterium P01_F01_bin.150]